MTAFAVYNPQAGNGRTGRQWQRIEEALESVFPLHSCAMSRGPGHTAELVREALRQGHLDIVAVGGDGTLNEAVNGFFEQGRPVSPDAVLSIVGTGTNNDFCRALALEPGAEAEAAMRRLARARIRKFDVGHLSCISPEGTPAARYFLGTASFGLSGRVACNFNRARIAKFFGARFARWLHSGLALAGWRECRVRLIADGDYDEIAGIATVALANGPYSGDGLKIAPAALPNDGLFDLVVMGGARRKRIAKALADLRDGLPNSGVRLSRTARLTAAPTLDTHGPVFIETDGETAGVLPARFEILPGAIHIRA